MITITINGQQYSHNASPAEEAALDAVWSARMADLPPGEGQDADTPAAERPGYHATPTVYLQWAIEHSYTEGMDVAAVMAGALASWAGNPVEPSPDVPLSPEQEKQRLRAYAINKRWRVEIGGTTVNSIPVPTDDRAKLLLLGAANSMADGSSAPLVINGVNYGTLTKAQFQAINTAIVAHVQNTVTTLASVLASIDSGTITTTTQIDEAFA